MSKESSKQELSVRERIALAVMLAIITLVKPSEWAHEVSNMTKQIRKEVGFDKDE